VASAIERCAERGRFVSPVGRGATPLQRFVAMCEFDPTTGCVLWTGGTSKGRGKTAPYGQFKFEGRVWWAHRWAAAHIHGHEIDGFHVDHCCPLDRAGPGRPLPPNTLCVHHVQPLTQADNTTERDVRRLWIRTQVGLLEPPPLFAEIAEPILADAVPFYEPPEWYVRNRLDGAVNSEDECPF
jgi:hypothetical protein